jgi:tetratricopeptide (TPR) repeat protein
LANQDIRLNSIFLKNRITELGIKQWWLAEQIGVDRKTVIRWIQGQVKSIQMENAERLTKVLECRIEDLSLSNEADHLASPEDQKVAAASLISSSFFEKLGPIGEWDVIENFLKATIVPNLPLNILGELYDKLTIASWRQSKIDAAALYNQKTEELARKSGDKTLLTSALLSKANIQAWRGNVGAAIEIYQQCIEYEKYIEPRTLGAIYSNLGGVLYEAGDLAEGERCVLKAIEVFQEGGRALNFSIAHCHLAILAMQQGQVDRAERESKIAMHYAQMDDYRRGLIDGKILQAEIAAMRGQTKVAQTMVEEALQEYAEMGIAEGLYFEQAGRTYRILGNLKKAKELLQKGIDISEKFPVYQAALYSELAIVLKSESAPTWLATTQRAIELYKKCQCPLRVKALQQQCHLMSLE